MSSGLGTFFSVLDTLGKLVIFWWAMWLIGSVFGWW